MMNKDKRAWDSALSELMRAAQAAGVPSVETRLWRVQHIDSSLSRLVRETEDSMQVIANVNSPGALRDLGRMYPPIETEIFASRGRGVRLNRERTGFRFYVDGKNIRLLDEDIFRLLKNLIDEFKVHPPRGL